MRKNLWLLGTVGAMILLMLSTTVASGASVTVINGCVMEPGTQCPGANLSNVKLTGQHLEGANLKGADLTNTNLTNTHLGGPNLQNATLTGANLTGVHLDSANLGGAIGTTWEQINTAYLCGTILPSGETVWHFADCKHCGTGK